MPKPLTYRQLYRALNRYFGVEERTGRKTSKRILVRPGQSTKGPFAPVSVRGEGTELSVSQIMSILRRLLKPEEQHDFWSKC